jgi:hypothetical protein
LRAFDQLGNEIAAEGATAVATGLRAITSMTRLSLGLCSRSPRLQDSPFFVDDLGAAVVLGDAGLFTTVATAYAEVVNSNTLMTCLDLTGMADKLQL